MKWFLAMLVVGGLVVTGCTAAKAEPTLTVTLEQSGRDLVIHMETTNFILGKTGYIHVQLDNGPELMPNTETYIIPSVKPGRHSVSAELNDPKHRPLGSKQVITIALK